MTKHQALQIIAAKDAEIRLKDAQIQSQASKIEELHDLLETTKRRLKLMLKAIEPIKKPKTKAGDQAPYLQLIWESYPQKGKSEGKRKAMEAWLRIPAKDRPDMETLKKALNAWNNSQQWKDGFVVAANRWISQRRWENLPEQVAKPQMKIV